VNIVIVDWQKFHSCRHWGQLGWEALPLCAGGCRF